MRHTYIIMVRLKNINKTKDYIEWDYYPEDSKEYGYIKMSLTDFEIMEERLHYLDKKRAGYTIYKRMSKNHLIRKIKNNETIPKEITVMWY